MKRKGTIITKIRKLKSGKNDWLSTKGMTITIDSYDYGIHEFKVLDTYRDNLLTFLAIEYNNRYIGDVDCSWIFKGHIGVLIGREETTSKYFRPTPDYYKLKNNNL